MEELILNYSEIMGLFVDNIKKFVFPEEWIDIDLSFSKQEIFTMLLVERHGEIIMSQIASYVNIPMSTATGIVDRLVKNGYLERERSESDRRIVVIKLSSRGKDLIDTIEEKGNEYVKLIQDNLTEEEREFLYSIFTKLIGILKSKQSENESKEETEIRKIDIE